MACDAGKGRLYSFLDLGKQPTPRPLKPVGVAASQEAAVSSEEVRAPLPFLTAHCANR